MKVCQPYLLKNKPGSVLLPIKPGKTLIATVRRDIIEAAGDGQLAVASTIDRQHINVNQSPAVQHSTIFAYVVGKPVYSCSSQVWIVLNPSFFVHWGWMEIPRKLCALSIHYMNCMVHPQCNFWVENSGWARVKAFPSSPLDAGGPEILPWKIFENLNCCSWVLAYFQSKNYTLIHVVFCP